MIFIIQLLMPKKPAIILPPNRGSLPEVIRRENPPPPTKGYLWYPPPALNGAEAGGAPRAPPRESCYKHPILGPVAPARRAAHGTSRKVAGGRRMEPSGSGSASLSLGPLRARPSGRLLSRRSAQQGKRARRRCASTQLYGVLRQAPLHAR